MGGRRVGESGYTCCSRTHNIGRVCGSDLYPLVRMVAKSKPRISMATHTHKMSYFLQLVLKQDIRVLLGSFRLQRSALSKFLKGAAEV